MSAAAILLRSSSSSAVGRNIIRRLQKTSALSSAYRALECNVNTNIPNYRSNIRAFSSKETVTITYCDPDGTEHPVEAEIGKHLLDVAHDNNIELEGACGGELACSTCHLVFEQEVYDALPPKSDEEEDMLDLAFELTETSRLGCQIRVVKEFDGIKVRIPDDGY
mmetsp:Transcript_14185/g.21915  ORF Transcript_14185/g.21915 Transcript_14185/m.21915 type:complete len:165 (+) Transcript_14185:87-581(+)